MLNPYIKITELKCDKMTDAKKALWGGLMTLMRDKPIHQISIKQLCQSSHVARSTFYVYYQNVDELLEEIENYHIIELLKMNLDIMYNNGYDESNMDFYQETVSYAKENKSLFYIFLVSYPNARFINKWKEAMKFHLWERICKKKEIKNSKLILEMTASEILRHILSGYSIHMM